jgi:hypothetical protein
VFDSSTNYQQVVLIKLLFVLQIYLFQQRFFKTASKLLASFSAILSERMSGYSVSPCKKATIKMSVYQEIRSRYPTSHVGLFLADAFFASRSGASEIRRVTRHTALLDTL